MATTKPEAWEFGRLEPEDLPDFEPIEFTLFGYDRKTKEEHGFVFHAKSTQPFGSTLDIALESDDKGDIPGNVAVKYLYDCLEEDDRAEWDEVVHRGPLHFDADALAQMAQKLIEFYNGGDEAVRPSGPRSARRAGSRRAGGTTTVEHSGRTSTSARSRSRTR